MKIKNVFSSLKKMFKDVFCISVFELIVCQIQKMLLLLYINKEIKLLSDCHQGRRLQDRVHAGSRRTDHQNYRRHRMNQDGLKGLNVQLITEFYLQKYRYAEHLVGFTSTNLIG